MDFIRNFFPLIAYFSYFRVKGVTLKLTNFRLGFYYFTLYGLMEIQENRIIPIVPNKCTRDLPCIVRSGIPSIVPLVSRLIYLISLRLVTTTPLSRRRLVPPYAKQIIRLRLGYNINVIKKKKHIPLNYCKDVIFSPYSLI